jgi:phytanoyl-CoA hydroxylase
MSSGVQEQTSAVTEADVQHFVDEGYLVVKGLVGPADVEAARTEAELFATGHYPADGVPEDGQLLAVHFPHWVSEVAMGLVRHAGIVDVVSRVAGAHLAHWNGKVKCMQSMLFLKPPGLQGQAWHQDERFIPTRDRSLIGAWMALDDATTENGCLWVIPGSHRDGVLFPFRDHGRPDEFDPTDEAYDFDASGAIPVEVQTGDVVFFNGYLLHRSLKNRSNGTRRALVNHYMSAGSLLPWMITKGMEVATADNRTVVPVTDDPYAWKGYKEPPSRVFVRPRSGAWSAPDPMHVDTSIAINAPIDVVWSTLTSFADYGSWNPFMPSAVGGATAGSTLAVTTKPTGAEREMHYDVTVSVLDAPTLMVWDGGLPDRMEFSGSHRFELMADGGVTILRQHERFSGTKADAIMATMGENIATDFRRFNEALRDESQRRHASR